MNRKCQWSWIERRWSISSSNVNRRVNWESPLFDLIENKSRGGRKFLECRWIVLYVLLIVVRFYQIKFSFPLTLWRGEIYIVAKDRLEITYHKIFCVHEKDVNSWSNLDSKFIVSPFVNGKMYDRSSEIIVNKARDCNELYFHPLLEVL